MPDANDLFYGALAFVILLVVIWKFAFPAVKQGMEGRSERIRADLAAGRGGPDRGRGAARATYQRQVADVQERGHCASSKTHGPPPTAFEAELHQRAEAEIAEMRQRAAADVEASKAQAIADLTRRGRLAGHRRRRGRGAEEPRPRDADAAHRELHQVIDGRGAART